MTKTVAKNELSEIIYDYEIQCVNSIEIVAVNDIDIASLITSLVVSTKMLAFQSETHSENNRTAITTKVVKYCNYCNKHYHELFECRELYCYEFPMSIREICTCGTLTQLGLAPILSLSPRTYSQLRVS